MAEQKDFNSLDDLFRKTFDDLPDSPGATGWDTPSDRVWQHVQTRIKPPRSGWSGGQILLVASGAIAIALGLYLAFSRPQQPAEPAATGTEHAISTPTNETPAAPEENIAAEQPSSDAAPEVVEPPVTTKKPANRHPAAQPPVAPAENERPATTDVKVNHSGQRVERKGSAPLPGSPPAEPNTTVLRNKRGAWAVPLQPLPSALDRREAPPLPDLPDSGQ